MVPSTSKNNCSQIKESQYNINYVCPSCHMSSQQTAQPTPTNQHTHTQTIPSPPLPHHPHHPQADLQQTTDKSQRDYNLKILQFNCNGISGKITEIISWMTQNDIKIAAIQETKLHKNSKTPSTPNYTLIRKDR